MRTGKIALIGGLALAMSLTANLAVARNASGDKSTGGVEYVNQNDNVVGISFNAHETPDGDADAKGTVSVVNHEFGTFADFEGEVDCYRKISDTEAVFSGEITEFDGPPGDPNSNFFRVAVEDNGSPGTAGPDKITAIRRETPQPCTDAQAATRDVVSGNLKVHH